MSDSADKRVYVDSNVLIYAVEGVQGTAAPAKELIKFLRGHRGLIFTSEISLAEVLAPSKRRGAWPLRAKRRVYLDLLVFSGAVQLVPVTREILIRTADLRQIAAMKLPDAIHLESAIRSGCRFLVTGDTNFKKLPPNVKKITPDEDGIRNLLEALA
ncbi:MAG TPA: PIN domain-containing protein [Xanthobacteraceae bacterium]|nr:PIN domain-containing protein [Xanthobacteraceae bacterium]